jgi:hypothetical protein
MIPKGCKKLDTELNVEILEVETIREAVNLLFG